MMLKQPHKSATTRKFVLAISALVLVFAGCSRRSDGGISSGTGGWPGSASPPEISSSAQVVKVRITPANLSTQGSAEAIVRLSITPGYHVNANPASFSYLIPTELTAADTDGISVGKPIYPKAETHKFQFAEEPLAVYQGDVEVKLPLRAGPGATPGSHLLPLSVRIQACDTEKCFPPANIEAQVSVEIK
jgi:thiol:disulfide interchange protein DsbD